MMSTLLRVRILPLYLQFCFILNLFAAKPILKEMMQNSGTESAHWPLKAGYPGLNIENLNDYVSLFSHCLVNIQNYQGIEIIGIQHPVRIARFDVVYLEHCWGLSSSFRVMYRFFYGKIPPKSEQNCISKYEEYLKDSYSDKSVTLRWYCTAHFDLFFPEPADAPHIVYYSQEPTFAFKRNFFDVSLGFLDLAAQIQYRDKWSKIRLIQII